jgi:glycerol kinase
VYDAIVWQCSRGAEICRRIESEAETVRDKTGLPLSPFFSAAKIAWVLDKTGRRDGLCAGTVDSWLVYKLTGNHFTDYSNASRTQLLNLRTLRWDEELCGLFGIDASYLPEIRDSNSCFGYTDFHGILPEAVPIHGVLGDSHAALYGQGCLKPGMAKTTYGTGSSVMVNIGREPAFCKSGIATSLAWRMDGDVNYVLEGNINYTGAVIKWLVEDVGLLSSPKDAGKVARTANPADNTYLVPAFSGLGAPYWNNDARAVICNMTRSTGRAEIVRAAEDCIAYQITDIIRVMRDEGGVALTELRVDGGPTRDSYLMQFQSDMLNLPLSVPANEELSCMGAAFAAGRALGLYDETVFERIPRTRYTPDMDDVKRDRLYGGWVEAVGKLL